MAWVLRDLPQRCKGTLRIEPSSLLFSSALLTTLKHFFFSVSVSVLHCNALSYTLKDRVNDMRLQLFFLY